MQHLPRGTQLAAGPLAGTANDAWLVLGDPTAEFPFGVRYQAGHRDEPVLVTVLDPALRRDPALRAELLASVRAAATLRHRNLLPVLAVHSDHEHDFVVEADLGADTLRDLVRHRAARGKALDAPTLFALLAHVCNALVELHPRVIHGFVNPETVLVTTTGRVLLSSAGFGPFLARLPETARLPELPPEQRQVWPQLGPGTDIYAVAAMFVELLTGRPLGEPGQSLAELGFEGPDDLVICLERATSPSVLARPPDIATFKLELGEAIAAHPMGVLDPGSSPLGAHPPWMGAPASDHASPPYGGPSGPPPMGHPAYGYPPPPYAAPYPAPGWPPAPPPASAPPPPEPPRFGSKPPPPPPGSAAREALERFGAAMGRIAAIPDGASLHALTTLVDGTDDTPANVVAMPEPPPRPREAAPPARSIRANPTPPSSPRSGRPAPIAPPPPRMSGGAAATAMARAVDPSEGPEPLLVLDGDLVEDADASSPNLEPVLVPDDEDATELDPEPEEAEPLVVDRRPPPQAVPAPRRAAPPPPEAPHKPLARIDLLPGATDARPLFLLERAHDLREGPVSMVDLVAQARAGKLERHATLIHRGNGRRFTAVELPALREALASQPDPLALRTRTDMPRASVEPLQAAPRRATLWSTLLLVALALTGLGVAGRLLWQPPISPTDEASDPAPEEP